MKNYILNKSKVLKLAAVLAISTAVSLSGGVGCGSLLGGEDDDSQTQSIQALAVLGLLSGCTIGGQTFTASAGITCSGGGAVGTGTLIANANSSAVLSLQLDVLLGAGGSVEIIAGTDTSGGSLSRGHGFNISTTQAQAFGPSVTGAVQAGGAAGTALKTYCLEMHTAETNVHLIADYSACVSKAAAGANYNSEVTETLNNGASSFRGWGIILNNATVSSATVNSGEIFTD